MPYFSQNMPSHTSREILLLMGSLTTCDPGDIQDTINNLKAQSIRCSVIGRNEKARSKLDSSYLAFWLTGKDNCTFNLFTV